jgi:hypothetical protein
VTIAGFCRPLVGSLYAIGNPLDIARYRRVKPGGDDSVILSSLDRLRIDR